MPHRMQHALEHPHVQLPFKTNWLWRGTQHPPKSSCPQRSSVWVYASDWERLSSQPIYRVVMSPRRAHAVHTCSTDMGPMSSP
eukprot:4172531-Amphidinium_carterae.1